MCAKYWLALIKSYLIYSEINASVWDNADEIRKVSAEQSRQTMLLNNLNATVQDALVLPSVRDS